MESVTLNSLLPGERGVVEHVANSHAPLRKRLLEMGLIRGTTVEFIRCAPMGDPIEVRIKGYRLSLRRGEAEAILVRKEKS